MSVDISIAEKMLRHSLLGEKIKDKWNIKLTAEFHMTNDSDLFHTSAATRRIPLYEGKMIWQFENRYAEPRYWINEKEGRQRLLGREKDSGNTLAYQTLRVGFRDVTSNTNERTLIASLVPPSHFCGNTLPTLVTPSDSKIALAVTCAFNSFALDWLVRQKVTNHCNFFYMMQLPV